MTSCGSPPVTTLKIDPTPNAIASIRSGCVRRHSRVGTRATSTPTQSQRHGTSSGRTAASNTATSGSTATSTQSRQTRRGGGGTAAGASQSERRGLVMPS